jgi:hypothetical protein
MSKSVVFNSFYTKSLSGKVTLRLGKKILYLGLMGAILFLKHMLGMRIGSLSLGPA